MNKCPKQDCGAKIEASLTIYLSDVDIDKRNGGIRTFRLSEHHDDTPVGRYEFFKGLIADAEGDELRIYCANDHAISPDGHLEESEDDDQ